VGNGEKLFTHLNSALKVLLGLDIFPRVPKKKLNFVDSVVINGTPSHTKYNARGPHHDGSTSDSLLLMVLPHTLSIMQGAPS